LNSEFATARVEKSKVRKIGLGNDSLSQPEEPKLFLRTLMTSPQIPKHSQLAGLKEGLALALHTYFYTFDCRRSLPEVSANEHQNHSRSVGCLDKSQVEDQVYRWRMCWCAVEGSKVAGYYRKAGLDGVNEPLFQYWEVDKAWTKWLKKDRSINQRKGNVSCI
jgi:hypothetical protein